MAKEKDEGTTEPQEKIPTQGLQTTNPERAVNEMSTRKAGYVREIMEEFGVDSWDQVREALQRQNEALSVAQKKERELKALNTRVEAMNEQIATYEKNEIARRKKEYVRSILQDIKVKGTKMPFAEKIALDAVALDPDGQPTMVVNGKHLDKEAYGKHFAAELPEWIRPQGQAYLGPAPGRSSLPASNFDKLSADDQIRIALQEAKGKTSDN